MSLLSELAMFGRFARDLPPFLRHRMTLEDARAIVRDRLESREANFLQLLERSVYGHPASPYLPLLRAARCELGDVRTMVMQRGIESTLESLSQAGVYLTFEQVKGREPVVCDGREFRVTPQDFDNPHIQSHWRTRSGGSTGAPAQQPTNLNHVVAMAPFHYLTWEAHGMLGAPVGVWRGVLPDGVGLASMLRGAIVGNMPKKWFAPVVNRDLRPALKYRLANAYILAVARVSGARVPWPRRVPLEEAGVVARWAAETARTHGRCLVRTSVSLALRVATAARGEGLDLTGVAFMGSSEPPTAAKLRGIEMSGARHIPTYSFNEGGNAGMGCARPIDSNDVHFLRDSLALIQRTRRVPGTEHTVDAFCFTTLLPAARRVLLNVETDDYGVVERRACGCPLEAIGYHDHIREIRSFRKLTGEGVTLVGSDMVRILEDVLPARFGGTPLDYQLLEEEDSEGYTRLSVVVSPVLGALDERAVVDAVLDAMARSSVAGDLARALWIQAQTLRVKRADPTWTDRGKLMPLQPASRS